MTISVLPPPSSMSLSSTSNSATRWYWILPCPRKLVDNKNSYIPPLQPSSLQSSSNFRYCSHTLSFNNTTKILSSNDDSEPGTGIDQPRQTTTFLWSLVLLWKYNYLQLTTRQLSVAIPVPFILILCLQQYPPVLLAYHYIYHLCDYLVVISFPFFLKSFCSVL
jgi:hypothetical protein